MVPAAFERWDVRDLKWALVADGGSAFEIRCDRARRLATFTLVDRALGTSGSGTQFFVDRGKRMGHILDPRTGQPAEGVISATVLAPTASESDALATALYTCGPQGLARIAPRGGNVSAIMVIPSKKRIDFECCWQMWIGKP